MCTRTRFGSVRFGSFRVSCASRSFVRVYVFTPASAGEHANEPNRERTEPNHARGRSGERDNLPNCDDDDDDKEAEQDSFEKQREDDDNDDGDGFGRCR